MTFNKEAIKNFLLIIFTIILVLFSQSLDFYLM